MLSDLEKRIAGILPYGEDPAAHDHSIRPNWMDLSVNFNAVPCNTDAAIICTSWFGHRCFLRATLTSLRMTGKFLICSYDPPVLPWSNENIYKKFMPTFDIFLLAHAWVHKHITFDSPKRNGWFWDVRYAQGIVNSFPNIKYVFTVNGDCPWEKPEGVNELIGLLGDADLMSVSSDYNTIHTAAILFKKESFNKIIDYMFEYHKVPIPGSYSPEGLLIEAVKHLGLVEKVVPDQPMEPDGKSVDHYSRYKQKHTWNDIVGYRNIGAEFLTAVIERLEPPEKKFIDDIFFDDSFAQYHIHLLKYYETGDRRYLHMCWDYNEDSWYDRTYYPIERYGKEPIIEEE